MDGRCNKTARGMTFVEVMIAIVTMMIIVIGTIVYQGFAAKQVRIAKSEMVAARTGQLLLEDWKSQSGVGTYDPNANGLGFGKVSSWNNATSTWSSTVDGVPMQITLAYADVATDMTSNVTLRRIVATVQWRSDFGAYARSNAPLVSFVLTTYVSM